jgi:hypothetical protein
VLREFADRQGHSEQPSLRERHAAPFDVASPLAPAYQARLDAMIEGTEKPNGAGRPGRRPRHDVHLLEGTKLLREWRGMTHEVTVVDSGYEHQGKRYRSLSAVARAITGTQWSGPLFFGLRKTGAGS